jgi:hypothetical protein
MAVTYANFDKNVCITATYTTAGEQESVYLPYTPSGYSVQLVPTGGSASIEASNDGIAWKVWDLGDVSAITISKIIPVKYIRVVHNTATESSLTLWGY